jgi:FixJ family two-component response regulator
MVSRVALEVAIVDDDPVILDELAVIFQADGFRVRTFISGGALLGAATPPPDCLVLDLHMPGMSGFDVLALIGGERYPAPIIMMSGRGDIATAVATIEAGAHDFIEKPFESTELIARVRQAVSEFAAYR